MLQEVDRQEIALLSEEPPSAAPSPAWERWLPVLEGALALAMLASFITALRQGKV